MLAAVLAVLVVVVVTPGDWARSIFGAVTFAAAASPRASSGDLDLPWRRTTWTIIGYSSAVYAGEVGVASLPDAVAAALGIAGLDDADARRLVTGLPTEPAST